MKFTGSSGIRARWSQDLLKMGFELGLALGNEYTEVAIASDFRLTGDSLLSSIISGITAGGADVYYGGKAPTPTLAYATKNHDAGVMVTASHNPPDYNGIKLWNPDGSAFSDEQMRKLSGGRVRDWRDVGGIKTENMLNMHREALLRKFKNLDLGGMRIAMDCSNGAGSVLTPFLLRDLGADVVTLNCHPSGLFPGHPSEPSEDNLALLIKTMRERNFDLGIAHDGDADRFVAVTRDGRYLSGDLILAIFTKVLGFRKIVAPVDSSMLLENFAEVIRCKVGDANVSQMMKSHGVKFGGENSGTQIFAEWRYTPDAIYAALKFAEIAMKEDIDSLVSSFPKYHTLRKSIHYESREEMERRIESVMKDYDVDRIDGYRVSLDDGWFLIRFSGTEPKVRITVEHEDENKAREIMDSIIHALKS